MGVSSSGRWHISVEEPCKYKEKYVYFKRMARIPQIHSNNGSAFVCLAEEPLVSAGGLWYWREGTSISRMAPQDSTQ